MKTKKNIFGKQVLLQMFVAAWLFLLILDSTVFAATFTVGSVAELQAALNTAAVNSENDTIKLADGTYSVTSTVSFWSDEEFSILIQGENMPILDGGNSAKIMELITVSGSGDLALDGLIFQHGIDDYGGALYAETDGAHISVNHCIFQDNSANYVCGGANLYSTTGNIMVADCVFKRNSSPNTSGYPYGTAGGLFIQTEGDGTEISVRDCTFEQNFAQRDGAAMMLYPLGANSTVDVQYVSSSENTANEFGGGCWIRCPNENATVTVKNSIFIGNSAAEAGSGGGTYIEIASGNINFSGNTISGNSCSWQGGGLWIEHGGGELTVQNNRFAENTAGQHGGGANIFIESGNAAVDHNIFYENQSGESGGGLSYSTTSAQLAIFNNTFSSNTASDGGDTYFYFDNSSASADFYNNILFQSTTPALSFSGAQTVIAKYSDIEGGAGESWFGVGCLNADPKFADAANGDFHLTWANFPISDDSKSPCIDAGDPTSPLDPDDTIADLGAVFFNQATGVAQNLADAKVAKFELRQNYPNPFNSSTLIKYSITKPGKVKLSVFNLKGRLVTLLVNDFQNPGDYEVLWNAENISSGVYFYRLEAGGTQLTNKLVLTR